MLAVPRIQTIGIQALAKKLLNRKTHLMGTLRKNRKGIPKEILEKKLKKGETTGQEKNDGIVIFKWHAASAMPFFTTKQTDKMAETRARNVARLKPKAIMDFSAKTFVDVSDQMSSYSSSLRRSCKWYRKLAIELLIGTTVVNFYNLWNKETEKRKIVFSKLYILHIGGSCTYITHQMKQSYVRMKLLTINR